MIGGRVLDVSAVVDFATRRSMYTQTLAWAAVERGIVLAVPVNALLGAWSTVGDNTWRALETLLDLPMTVIDDIDRVAAREIGRWLAHRDAASLAAAQVAWSAVRRGWPVITADPTPLLTLHPDIEIERLP
ncbi:MAG: hypothetical protein ACRDPK_20970 [Carbonactinosporaceae bacterium]